jgi:hypothetical protein
MNTQLIKTAGIAGVVGGLFFCLFFFLTCLVFTNPFAPFPKSLEFFIYLLTIISPLAYYRFRQNKGFLRFWEGILISVLASVLMLLIGSVFVFIYLQHLDNQPINQYINYYTDLVQTNQKGFIEKYGQAGYDHTIQNLQKTSATQLALEELKKSPICLIMSLIGSALFRK